MERLTERAGQEEEEGGRDGCKEEEHNLTLQESCKAEGQFIAQREILCHGQRHISVSSHGVDRSVASTPACENREVSIRTMSAEHGGNDFSHGPTPPMYQPFFISSYKDL